mgnify:CR=1 FL=1
MALSLKLLCKDEELSNKQMTDAYVLGWCVELVSLVNFIESFSFYFLVADDIMDGSTTRRGQPCWYKKDNLGMLAINDAILLETCIYTLLDKHFRDAPYYLNLLDAFLYVSYYLSYLHEKNFVIEYIPTYFCLLHT